MNKIQVSEIKEIIELLENDAHATQCYDMARRLKIILKKDKIIKTKLKKRLI